MKSLFVKTAAAALVAGAAGFALVDASNAEIVKLPPLVFYCAAHFNKNGSDTNYTCDFAFPAICAKGLMVTSPQLTFVNGKYHVTYSCSPQIK